MVHRLPPELLFFIGCKLDCAADRIRFRAVSKSWRSALPFRQPPWLVRLSRPQSCIQLISAGDQTFYNIDVPDTYETGRARIGGSTGNWLTTFHTNSKLIHLLNPLSKAQFQLPSCSLVVTHPIYLCYVIVKVVLSSPPPNATDTTDVIAMGMYWNWSGGSLGIARPGDTQWTAVGGYPEMNPIYFEDCVYYKNQFYAVCSKGKVVVCDIGDGSRPPQLSLLLDCCVNKPWSAQKYYLVECSGELLMVVRTFGQVVIDMPTSFYYRPNPRTSSFKAYKLDFVNRKFEELKGLGDHSLFLGLNASAALRASDYFGLIRRNCIYFTDDLVCVNFMANDRYVAIQTYGDIGVFDLESNSLMPHYKGTFSSAEAESVWIVST